MPRWSPHPVTLRQLQYALAVAEFGNFRKAAEACAIAQPSLSSQIRAARVGARGAALRATHARRRRHRRGPRSAGARAANSSSRPTIWSRRRSARATPTLERCTSASFPTVAPYLLPDIAPALRARFPRVRFFWEEEKTHTLVERLESGSLDAGILALESDMNELAYAVATAATLSSSRCPPITSSHAPSHRPGSSISTARRCSSSRTDIASATRRSRSVTEPAPTRPASRDEPLHPGADGRQRDGHHAVAAHCPRDRKPGALARHAALRRTRAGAHARARVAKNDADRRLAEGRRRGRSRDDRAARRLTELAVSVDRVNLSIL